MSLDFMVEDTKKKIEVLEEQLEQIEGTTDWRLDDVKKSLKSYRNKLRVLEDKKTLELAVNDMKIITQHTKAIEDKYNCRSVKFMFWLADRMPKNLATRIREYTINKINAPVCSIAGGPKPELPAMPSHVTSIEREREERVRKEREELLKFRSIAVGYLDYKPSRWERTKEKIRTYVNKVLA